MRLLRSYRGLRISSRGLLGAYTSTFLFEESCRLQQLGLGTERFLGDAVGCILLVPRVGIDAVDAK